MAEVQGSVQKHKKKSQKCKNMKTIAKTCRNVQKKGENGQNQLRYQTNCKIGKKCVTKAKNGQKQPKMAKKNPEKMGNNRQTHS